MLLQSSTLGELCAGIGTVSLAATILKDNVLSELGAGMKLSTVFVLDRLLATYVKDQTRHVSILRKTSKRSSDRLPQVRVDGLSLALLDCCFWACASSLCY